jgi:hypothetical protein
MKLELKHIIPYIPFQLKAQDIRTKEIRTVTLLHFTYDLSTVGHNHLIYDGLLVSKHLPILRPILDLSILVKDEFEKYDGIRSGKADEEVINIFCEENGVDEIIENIDLKSLPYECIEYMFKNHYDFFGLIEAGLAIDIKTLNN